MDIKFLFRKKNYGTIFYDNIEIRVEQLKKKRTELNRTKRVTFNQIYFPIDQTDKFKNSIYRPNKISQRSSKESYKKHIDFNLPLQTANVLYLIKPQHSDDYTNMHKDCKK